MLLLLLLLLLFLLLLPGLCLPDGLALPVLICASVLGLGEGFDVHEVLGVGGVDLSTA